MNLVFVYGSLKTGFSNNWLLQSHEARLICLEARTHEDSFFMESLGSFPAVVRSDVLDDLGVAFPVTRKRIVGELWEVSDPVLARLDRLESNGHLYQRESVSVEISRAAATKIPGKIESENGQVVQAWMYLLNRPEWLTGDKEALRYAVAETSTMAEWVMK